MKWLTLFFIAAFIVGDVLMVPLDLLSLEPIWKESLWQQVIELMLINDVLLVVPIVFCAAAIRIAAGRLSGFGAGIVSAIWFNVLLAAFGDYPTHVLGWALLYTGSRVLGPMLVAQIAIFRERALLRSPPGIEGLCGMDPFVLAAGESVSSVVGRRRAGGRRGVRTGGGTLEVRPFRVAPVRSSRVAVARRRGRVRDALSATAPWTGT
jgi:hypothetical protein